MEVLIWITDTKIEASVLRKMSPSNSVIATLLDKLVEQKYLKGFECVLITNTIRNGKPTEHSIYPQKVNERALRVSFLFSKLFYILHSCLSSIDLDFEVIVNPFISKSAFIIEVYSLITFQQPDFQFDNILFHKLYEAADETTNDNDAQKAIASFENLCISN